MNSKDIINAQQGFIDGPFTDRLHDCKNIETKTGKTMSVGKFGEIDVTSFDHDLHKWNNHTVELSGKGMKRDEYNNYPKLMIGKATRITEAQGTPEDAPLPTTAPARPAAPTRTDDDFIPQTLCHVMGAALTAALADPEGDGVAKPAIIANYMVSAYEARDMAVEIIRGKL